MARKKRDDGRVQVQVDIGVTEDGKRKRKYFYGRTLKEANAARDAWLAEQERRKRVTVADADVTLEEWGEMWLASIEGTTQGTTFKSKVSAVRAHSAHVLSNGVVLGSLRVCDVKPIQIQDYMSSLSGLSKGTIALRRGVLKAVFECAVANGVITKSPWNGVRVPRGTYKGHACPPDETLALIDATWQDHRCGIWALTLRYTGMRREELAALDASAVDFATDTITISAASVLKERGRLKETKTEAGQRTVPILKPLREPLRQFVSGRTSGRLFLSANGDALTDTSFRQAWRSYMRFLNLRAGGTDKTRGRNDERGHPTWIPAKIVVQPFTPHDLRYAYATMLYDAGVDVKTAGFLLGHADVMMTMKIYTQLSAKRKATGIDALIKYTD